MFNKKQLYLIGGLALALSLVLVQVQVRAAWNGPSVGPNGTNTNPPLTNPLTTDLNLGTKNIINGGASFTGLNLNNSNLTNGALGNFANLNISNNLNVATINGVPYGGGGGGGVENPLAEDLSGNNKFGIKQLMSCKPSSDGEICSAVEAVADQNTNSKAYSFGLYGYTLGTSDTNPTYGVYGFAASGDKASAGVAGRGSIGVYGYSDSSSGAGVSGVGAVANSIGVYGEADDATGVAGSFQNTKGGTALAIDGKIDFANVKITRSNGGESVGYSGTQNIFIDESNLSVDGSLNAGHGFSAFGGSTLSGGLRVEGMTTLEQLTTLDAGLSVHGLLRVDGREPNYSHLSAIVGVATSTNNFEPNAGVEGIGTVGVYGNGHLVGVFGESSGYGAIFKGSTAIGWNPPPGGEGAGDDTPSHGFITKLFGLDKTYADVNTPAALGLVAAGGWNYSGGITKAGLGICALSGEKAWAVDNAGGDFNAYCKSGSVNNFAGFFAGDVYVKEGSMQLNDSLTVAGENLIYGNIGNTSVAGSSLLKLQNNNADKFVVDKDGNVMQSGAANNYNLNMYRSDFAYISMQNAASGVSSTDGFQIGFENTGTYFVLRENLDMHFRTHNTERLTIKNNGTIGIANASPSATYKLDVTGAINSTGNYYANGTAGLASANIRVRNYNNTDSCNITVKSGLVTATDCP